MIEKAEDGDGSLLGHLLLTARAVAKQQGLEAGYRVVINNGEQGCQMAADHLPDVILMDVVMPEMNGFQATRKITRGKTTAHIPVIMISTKNQETDRVWGKRQGAKEYMNKPIDESSLVNIIRRVME